MSAPVISVTEDTELGEIARVLVTHRIKRVPVVRGGRVTGIVARDDVLRALASSKTDL
jgi:CBS domain-containing protein